MESNARRIEVALEGLRAAAEKAIMVFPNDGRYRGPLEVVSRLSPGALEIARQAHTELVDQLADDLEVCGQAPEEVVGVVNGVKELVEDIEGLWFFEDGRWQNWNEHRTQTLAEVAK